VLLLVTGGLFTLALFHFLGRAVGEVEGVRRGYGADYFSFALLGLATASLLRTVQTGCSGAVRNAQNDGSLEALLASPLATFHVVSLMAAFPTLNALVRALAFLALGAGLFGARLQLSPLAFGVTLALALLAFAALGLLSAAFVLVFKRGDPFTYALDLVSYLLAGVLYPPDVLPPALRALAPLLPATHALHGLRAAALQGAGAATLWPSWAALAAFSVILWPLAALAVARARRHVEQAGTLPHG
jgi:ABC-2 type transport system permease protein